MLKRQQMLELIVPYNPFFYGCRHANKSVPANDLDAPEQANRPTHNVEQEAN